ncbi:MAG: hypothetical protein ACXAC7_18540, partial [Candidatus Hodarchaeales archaeon]
MSEIIKIAYRSIGGFFAILFMFVFGVVGISLIVSGSVVVAAAIYVVINPKVIDGSDISWGSRELTEADAGTAFLVLLFVAVVILIIGALFISLTTLIGKASLELDKELG